jgi:ribosomal protein S27E
MPTLQFKCPSCRKLLCAYVDQSTKVVCHCGAILKPDLDGKAAIFVEPIPSIPISPEVNKAPVSKPSSVTPRYNNDAATVKEKDQSALGTTLLILVFVFLLIFGGLYAYEWYKKFSDTKSEQQHVALNSPIRNKGNDAANYQPPTPVIPQAQTQSRISNDDEGIVYVHIVNTFMKTDKYITSVALLNEATKTLTLKAKDKPSSLIKIITGDAGVVDVQFINSGTIEAEKQFFRRSDLESGDGSLIYTSRTGEITMTLSY